MELFELVLVLNLTDEVLSQTTFGANGQSSRLLQGGYATLVEFGGSGATTLETFGDDRVYAMLIAEGDLPQFTLTFSDGGTGSYDVVVGAEGAHSKLREELFGMAHKPVYTGQAVWRAMVPPQPSSPRSAGWRVTHGCRAADAAGST